MRNHEPTGREVGPTAPVIACQSVKKTECGGVRGRDVAKKIKRRKRHHMVGIDGRAFKLQVHSDSTRNEQRAHCYKALLARSRTLCLRSRKIRVRQDAERTSLT